MSYTMVDCLLTVNWGTRARRGKPCCGPLRAVAQVGLRRTLCDMEPESHEGARALNMSRFSDCAGRVFHGPPDTMDMQPGM